MADHYYRMDWTAFEADTQLLDVDSVGALLLFMNMVYRTGRRVPDDAKLLGRLWRCHPNRARAIRATLLEAGCIHWEDGFLFNKRCEREIEKRMTQRTQKQDAAHTRWRQKQDNLSKSLENKDAGDADAHIEEKRRIDSTSQVETPPSPPEKQTRPSARKRASVSEGLPGFDLFWQAYPRREARKHAEKAYAKALKEGASPEDILRGARAYAERNARTEPRYIRLPATWLNGGGWEDAGQPARRTSLFSLPAARAV